MPERVRHILFFGEPPFAIAFFSVTINIIFTDSLIVSRMGKLVINSFAEFEQHIGKELGVSEYLRVTQDQINLFAQATLDHQWIHTDPERAARESQFKSTIAHGYLTLSLVPYLWEQIAEVNNIKMLVNYGIENLKFNQPVLVNQDVRLRVKLLALINLRGITKTEMQVTLEIKDNPKPAFTATIVFLYHFA
jgi:acyl dehydratase